jgi:hypothetical protein
MEPANFERPNVRAINPVVLEALQSNDPQWTETFNLEALRRKSQRVKCGRRRHADRQGGTGGDVDQHR